MIKFFRTTVFLLLVTSVMALLISFAMYCWVHTPVNLQQDEILSVKKGDTLSAIAYRLSQQDVLVFPRLLTLYARFTSQTQLQVGEFLIRKGTTQQGLLDLLQSNDVITYKVTLVEGKTFKQWLDILAENEKIEQTLTNKETAFKQLLLDIKHPEGWFFPDTYQFASGTTDKDILVRAHQRMQKVLMQEWGNRADKLPYENAYEALIMASIIEKETGVAYERPEIAGVFVRRLQKGMRLQTDPTIIYGLGDRYKGNIRRKHLTQKTPYNTYVIDGLPPTPIAMPGREAINAALHPKEGKSLYFVAKGDGSHYFSNTLREHNKAVQEYQIKKRNKNYRSAPPVINNK